jgi:deoxyribodipyrimidine photo-lyase
VSDLPAAFPFPPGESEAKRRLGVFLGGDAAPVFAYGQQRDLPGVEATSGLSPYFRFGMLSARLAAVGAYEAIDRAPDPTARKGAEVWLNELIWREFYVAILHHFPHVQRGSFRPAYDKIQWRNDPADFAAWCAGRTGYPLVDAAMRQLQATGWMHNRVRMVAASFLVKDLLIDWRWGERWFMQQLVDGDPASNNGGWQWTAGTGTDAAPYFRVFSPVAQGQKFDPTGGYVRRWAPELEGVPDAYIHAPWEMATSEQIKARCVLGVDYPAPIVDHGFARERVLEAYRAVSGV